MLSWILVYRSTIKLSSFLLPRMPHSIFGIFILNLKLLPEVLVFLVNLLCDCCTFISAVYHSLKEFNHIVELSVIFTFLSSPSEF